MDDLALEVGELNGVEIHDAELADARRGQVHGDGRAEPARADAEHAGGANFLFALQPDFGQNQMPRVAADFVVVQVHASLGAPSVMRELKAGAARRQLAPAPERRRCTLAGTASDRFPRRRSRRARFLTWRLNQNQYPRIPAAQASSTLDRPWGRDTGKQPPIPELQIRGLS